MIRQAIFMKILDSKNGVQPGEGNRVIRASKAKAKNDVF